MATINCARCGQPLTPEQAGKPCPNCGSLDRNLTADEIAVVAEKAEVARRLAKKHYTVESGITEIFTVWTEPKYEATRGEPVKLLEVNRDTIASGVMPLGFDAAPASGVPFPSVIIEVTPEEMQRIQNREMPLPHGWVLGSLVPRPDSSGNGSE